MSGPAISAQCFHCDKTLIWELGDPDNILRSHMKTHNIEAIYDSDSGSWKFNNLLLKKNENAQAVIDRIKSGSVKLEGKMPQESFKR